MTTTIHPPKTTNRPAILLAAAAVVFGATVGYGATAIDFDRGGSQQPAAVRVDTSAPDTSGLAEWAEANGLTGASPTSLRPATSQPTSNPFSQVIENQRANADLARPTDSPLGGEILENGQLVTPVEFDVSAPAVSPSGEYTDELDGLVPTNYR